MKLFHRKRSITVLMVSLALISTCSKAENTDSLDDFSIDSTHTTPVVKEASAHSLAASAHPSESSGSQNTSQDSIKNKKIKKSSTRSSSQTSLSVQQTLPELKKDTAIVSGSIASAHQEQASLSDTNEESKNSVKTATATPPASDQGEEVPEDSFLGSLAKHLKFSSSPEENRQQVAVVSSNQSENVSAPTSSMWKTVEQVAMGALGLLGVHYRWGGNTPETGLDCSGFVRYVFNQALGIKLPRTSHEISQVGVKIDGSHLIPGDLVFFNTRNISFSHVGIYLGDNRFIHSPRTGKNVEIGRITDRYWSARFDGGRRILGQLAARSASK